MEANLKIVAPGRKPVPLTVTAVPPSAGPEFGLTPETVGRYLNWSATTVGLVPPRVVTCTSTIPTGSGGDVATIEVGELTVKPEALAGPNVTAVALARLIPLSVTEVPPPDAPLAGMTPVTAGGSGRVVKGSSVPDA